LKLKTDGASFYLKLIQVESVSLMKLKGMKLFIQN
jgi:hypothetical protein